MAKSAITDLDRHIGIRLRQLRQQHRISAEKLAEALETTQQQISRYENGNNKLSASQLYCLAEVLSVPLAWFFLGYQPIEPYPSLLEADSGYAAGKSREQLEIISAHWPQLSSREREMVLKLMDTFLVERLHAER